MTNEHRTRPIPRAALLDAMGTLLTLQPPGPLLAARLAAHGVAIGAREATDAFRVEIAYYREHHLEGSDRRSLADLRCRCAAAMHAALPANARARISVASLCDAMLDSLRMRPMPGAKEMLLALRRMGMRLVVLSNWDVSLSQTLERAGLSGSLDGVVTSAAFGAAKPDPAIFRHALDVAGAEPEQAIHLGDSPELDVAGARSAGIQPILLGGENGAGVPVIASLNELPALLRSLQEGS